MSDSRKFYLNDDDLRYLQDTIEAVGAGAGQIIDRYLQDTGGDEIEHHIQIPVSGRRWKGKKRAARDTKPFRQQFSSLAVTIHTRQGYHYLYFPDDGSNTVHHYGGQHFMLRGAEDARETIVDGIAEQLMAAIFA